MQVFVTGASGWVGSAVVTELLAAGHRVRALVRSQEKARTLVKMGATPVIGTLEDLSLLCNESILANAIIHTAFNHDFSRYAESVELERRALAAVGEAITGLGPRLIVTSGVAMLSPGRVATEHDAADFSRANARQAESIARRLATYGVPTSIIRLAPTVHAVGEHGFISSLIELARTSKVSAYIGTGLNRWPAVHLTDVATLYRLAAEHRDLAPMYHAIGEEGIDFIRIAEAIGRHLGLPVEPREAQHFGWLGMFAAADIPASSDFTQSTLDWNPSGPKLLEQLNDPDYYSSW